MNLRTVAAFVIGLSAAAAASAQTFTLRGEIPFSFVRDCAKRERGHAGNPGLCAQRTTEIRPARADLDHW